MVFLKAAYYLDELNEKLEILADRKVLDGFYRQIVCFSITDMPAFIDFDETNPLLKTCWNIISRGITTRCSLFLGDYILREHLKQDYKGLNYGRQDVRAQILDLFLVGLDKAVVSHMLGNFSAYTEAQIATELGTKYLNLYRVLVDLVDAAQIQEAIILKLLNAELKDEVTIAIPSMRVSFAETIVEDINQMFEALNALVKSTEVKLPRLHLDNQVDATGGPDKCRIEIILNKNISEEDTVFDNILTDRRIMYRELGTTLEEEINDKLQQRFEYATQEQKNGLLYFLQNIFRKTKFRPGQEAIINRILQGKDVIGLLPTGGGKSLTYQLCGFLHPGVTVVVDPINSLMKDQYDKLISNGITKTLFINSFNTKEEREENLQALTDSKVLIFFVSPERFQIENFRSSLYGCLNNKVYYSFAVIDEAHCVSEWGHDFRHSYLKLAQNLKRFCKAKGTNLTMVALTATASFDVLADVQRELEMAEDAIVSLPPEAIDRKELNFEIIKISQPVDTAEFWKREKQIGNLKYPIISSFFKSLPPKIQKLEKRYGYFNPNPDFYNKINEKFLNAGVIFCPTKSNKLSNGVITLSHYLEASKFLSISTFFGGGDENTIKDDEIESLADESYKNQEEFINNNTNLMIATKAFGMGIDKPNIRYTIHYSFPNSVESFYQEAGRAGRDSNPSVCTILYHPEDIHTNMDFYKNSFKGIEKERQVLNELLDEVHYEDDFFVNVIDKLVKIKYPNVGKVSLWNNKYLHVFGVFGSGIRIGKVNIEYQDLPNYDGWRENIEKEKADEILEYLRVVLRKECADGNYKDWLCRKSASGINTLLASNKKDKYVLQIGFTNNVITLITKQINLELISNKTIKVDGKDKFYEVIVKAAYSFSTNETEFVENLKYQYGKYTKFTKELKLSSEVEELIRDSYQKIRNTSDTLRAIYRMSIVGIIDDYVIDYVDKLVEVRFIPKKEEAYKNNFRNYLKRYLGEQSTQIWLDKIESVEDASILKKVLFTLVAFIDEVIAKKRKLSISYMKGLCEIGTQDSDTAFRENIVYYFTSKYARIDYLPKDTDNGKIESIEIVNKYLDFIFNPPDSLGGEIDNAKHLRGACANLRISMTEENASIDLLTSFSLFALDAKDTDSLNNTTIRPLVKEAVELYRKGFRRMLKIADWQNCKALIRKFNDKVLDINPFIKPLIAPLTNELLINRSAFVLNEFLNKIS